MADKTIAVIVNGFKESVPAGTSLERLIAHFQEADADLIVERNGRFVYPKDYAATKVASGDRIEFINPNFGG